jgi:hypothetical protein
MNCLFHHYSPDRYFPQLLHVHDLSLSLLN